MIIYQNLSLVSCMDEENSSLWPWVLGLMAFKVYNNKKNNFDQNFFNSDSEIENFDNNWEEE